MYCAFRRQGLTLTPTHPTRSPAFSSVPAQDAEDHPHCPHFLFVLETPTPLPSSRFPSLFSDPPRPSTSLLAAALHVPRRAQP